MFKKWKEEEEFKTQKLYEIIVSISINKAHSFVYCLWLFCAKVVEFSSCSRGSKARIASHLWLLHCKFLGCNYKLTSASSRTYIDLLWDFIITAYPLYQNKKKKKKVNFECCIFKVQWNVDYFVIKLDVKVLCLLCDGTIAVLKKILYTPTLLYQALDTIFSLHRNVTEKLGKLKWSISSQ